LEGKLINGKDGILIVTRQHQPANYLPKLIEALQHYPVGQGVNHVSIAHDDWCNLLSGKGPCNCDPEVQILGVEH
jgi:hypothetical protein